MSLSLFSLLKPSTKYIWIQEHTKKHLHHSLNWFYSRVARLVQHIQIGKCKTIYMQIWRQKSHDYLNRHRKGIQQSSTYFHDERLKKLEIGGFLEICWNNPSFISNFSQCLSCLSLWLDWLEPSVWDTDYLRRIAKPTYDKPPANIIWNKDQLETISSKSETSQGC